MSKPKKSSGLTFIQRVVVLFGLLIVLVTLFNFIAIKEDGVIFAAPPATQEINNTSTHYRGMSLEEYNRLMQHHGFPSAVPEAIIKKYGPEMLREFYIKVGQRINNITISSDDISKWGLEKPLEEILGVERYNRHQFRLAEILHLQHQNPYLKKYNEPYEKFKELINKIGEQGEYEKLVNDLIKHLNSQKYTEVKLFLSTTSDPVVAIRLASGEPIAGSRLTIAPRSMGIYEIVVIIPTVNESIHQNLQGDIAPMLLDPAIELININESGRSIIYIDGVSGQTSWGKQYSENFLLYVNNANIEIYMHPLIAPMSQTEFYKWTQNLNAAGIKTHLELMYSENFQQLLTEMGAKNLPNLLDEYMEIYVSIEGLKESKQLTAKQEKMYKNLIYSKDFKEFLKKVGFENAFELANLYTQIQGTLENLKGYKITSNTTPEMTRLIEALKTDIRAVEEFIGEAKAAVNPLIELEVINNTLLSDLEGAVSTGGGGSATAIPPVTTPRPSGVPPQLTRPTLPPRLLPIPPKILPPTPRLPKFLPR